MLCSSNYVLTDCFHEDHSYPSPMQQLKWRIEDLRMRLNLIIGGRYGNHMKNDTYCRYSKDELAYAPPDLLFTESDVLDAIAIAEETLVSFESDDLLGCFTNSIEQCEESEEMVSGQITFCEIIQCESFFAPNYNLCQVA